MPTGSGGGKNALRETLDLHSSFTWEKFLEQGLDAHFICRKTTWGSTSAEIIVSLAKTSDYWTQDDYSRDPGITLSGYFRVPADMHSVAIYSRRAFNYPVLSCYTIFPDLTVKPRNTELWIGLENGGSGYNGLIAFRLMTTAVGVEILYAFLRGVSETNQIDITALMPDDFHTARHVYTIELTKSLAVFRVDAVPVCYGLLGVDTNPDISGPPYAIVGCEAQPARAQSALLEGTRLGGEALEWVLSPYGFRVADGDPQPSRALMLYEEDTENLFTDKTVGAGTLVSHPFPILGYGKTIHFRADQDSVANGLIIEYYTQAGNWRTYDEVTYAADDDWFRTPTGEGVLARLSYEPAAYPAVISEGEVVLR